MNILNGKISIVMPCYKAEAYIEDTLNDILAQTYTNWELICVSNGAGQEPQLKILERFSRTGGGDKIKILTEEKGDRCRARNIGIKAATGEWITFSDQDDRIEPDHLQRYMDKAREEEADIIMGGHKQIRVKEGTIIERRFPAKKQTLNEVIMTAGSALNSVWDKMFRASFLKQSGVLFHEDLDFLEDIIFVQETLLLKPRVSTLEMGGYRWICRDKDSGSSTYKRNFWEARMYARDLERRLLSMAGCTEGELSTRMSQSDYIQGYFFVCNLFKKGSPLSFGEARREIKRVIFDDASMRQAIDSQDRAGHNLFLKIYDWTYRLGSAWWMAAVFQLQYSLKYSMMPLYLKIVPRLRR